MKIHKTFDIKVLKARKDGGRILISTAEVDRDRDRLFPDGIQVDHYLKNPIVQWGHNYRDPWATIGKTDNLEIQDGGVVADFTLRPAANDQDPQNVVRLLWDGGWIRTASVGFMPTQEPAANDFGGKDYAKWELLEWSLVPVPANQGALRLAMKKLDKPEGMWLIKAPCHMCNRETNFSATLFFDIATGEGAQLCADCTRLNSLASKEVPSGDIAWIRKLTVESGAGKQQTFACFRSYKITVPDDADKLMSDDKNGLYPAPHPHAGKTIDQKEVVFVPPIEVEDDSGQDAVYSMSAASKSDEDLVGNGGLWEVAELSDVLLSLQSSKSFRRQLAYTMDICLLKHRDVQRVKGIVLKRGRVLSAKNEGKIKTARDNLDEVLAEVEQLPEIEEESRAARTFSKQETPSEHLTMAMGDLNSAMEHCRMALEMMGEGEGEEGEAGKDLFEKLKFYLAFKGAIPPHTTPKADEGADWDAGAVLREIEGEAELRLVHAWVNSELDPEVKGAYKLPHHYADGRVVWRGVAAAGTALMGGRGGVDIPDADVAGVKRHLAGHYRQFDKVPPWEEEGTSSLPEHSGEETAADEELLTELGDELRTLLQIAWEVYHE